MDINWWFNLSFQLCCHVWLY